MGRLYEACQQIIRYIDHEGLDPYKTRGAIALRTGFLITMVQPNDSDDQKTLDSVCAAAREVLQLEVKV